MMYKIVETWFGRFKVYEIAPYGQTEDTWIATFRRRYDADQFVKLYFKIEETQQPIF